MGIIPVKIILVSLPHNHWDQYMCDMYNNSSDKLNYCWQHPKIKKKIISQILMAWDRKKLKQKNLPGILQKE